MKLQGAYTAIVTPFNQDGSVDYGKLKALIDWQAESGITGIVPVGTTGESPTLENDEHLRVIEVTTEACRGKMQVIAGSGANATEEALMLTRRAQAIGVDASLQVTPYYNKPSQEGLYRHFSTIADVGVPVVLYNVPGRSGQEIAIETIERLAAHPNIVAVKEAGGSVDRVSAIRQVCDLAVLSGDDILTLPMMSVGALGVISVASNVIPQQVVDMVKAALSGDYQTAGDWHRKLYPLFTGMFLDTNPIPVKAAMAMTGRIDLVYRLPMCEPSASVLESLRTRLASLDCLPAEGAQS